MNAAVRAIVALVKRELVGFYRQRGRVLGTLGTPLIFWLLMGTGLRAAFPESEKWGTDFLAHFYPANLLLTLLFASIFSNISLIEDRNEGFFQSVLVAPVSRWAIVAGKLLGGTLIATSQAVLFLCAAPAVGFGVGLGNLLPLLGFLVLTSFGLTAVGFWFAWRLNSIQGFHSVMNLVLFPLWLISAAFFPMVGSPAVIQFLVWANPISYSAVGITALLTVQGGAAPSATALELWLCFAIALLFAGVFYILCVKAVDKNV